MNDDAKLLPFTESEAGATGLELLLPLALKWAENQKLSLAEAIAKITYQPAQILGINSGDLSVGGDADIAIFNPEKIWKVTPSELKSHGKNTPFLGLEVMGKVQYTLLHGQITYQSSCIKN